MNRPHDGEAVFVLFPPDFPSVFPTRPFIPVTAATQLDSGSETGTLLFRDHVIIGSIMIRSRMITARIAKWMRCIQIQLTMVMRRPAPQSVD